MAIVYRSSCINRRIDSALLTRTKRCTINDMAYNHILSEPYCETM